MADCYSYATNKRKYHDPTTPSRRPTGFSSPFRSQAPLDEIHDTIDNLNILNLLRLGRPLTAASSFNSPNSRPEISKSHHLLTLGSAGPNPTFKPLPPLNRPAKLFGTISLPNLNRKCSTNNCLQFADDSSTICCDILDFDARIIGKSIYVLAWNFLPLKHSGGFLEIIKWSFPNSNIPLQLRPCVNVHSIPLVSSSSGGEVNPSKSIYHVLGTLESIGPISKVPCSTGEGSENLRGFLVRVLTCVCKSCSSKESITALDNFVQRYGSHTLNKPLFVYFSGSLSYWHPAITKLVGCAVMLSGMKKKLIVVGKDASELMYVTTMNSVLHLLKLSNKVLPLARTVINGKGESGTYTGVVMGVQMHGMMVELDNDVWLLLTDQLFTPPHSLRVGAVISARNVHFVNPKFSWGKMLILGACFKTSITVKSFSPLDSGCHNVSHSQGQLGKFTESLQFSARLWVLLLVPSFRKKFGSLFSEKEILGSKHNEGMVQMYARSNLHSSAFQDRFGVFKELLKHDHCGCVSEPSCGDLKLVAPISLLLGQCEAVWIKKLLESRINSNTLCNAGRASLLMCDGVAYGQSLRTFRSDDIGIVLMGKLMISPSCERLQLVDQTGSIDAIVSDLPPTWNANIVYEVTEYVITVEGVPNAANHLDLPYDDFLACRNIFNWVPLARKRNLKMYVSFQLKNASCRNLLSRLCVASIDDRVGPQNGRFHLIRVIHKFPKPQKVFIVIANFLSRAYPATLLDVTNFSENLNKIGRNHFNLSSNEYALIFSQFCGDSNISNRPAMFLEALLLPWYILIGGKGGTTCPDKSLKDQLNQCSVGQSCKQFNPNKRRKTESSSTWVLSASFSDNVNDAYGEMSSCGSCRANSEIQASLSSKTVHEISCVATIRTTCSRSRLCSAVLCSIESSHNFKHHAKKILLEFEPDNFHMYQIGGYYIAKDCLKDAFCTVKDCVSIAKVTIPSEVQWWSLAFHSDVDSACEISSNDSPQKDVTLHLCACGRSLVEVHPAESKDAVTRAAVIEAKSSTTSPYVTAMETSPWLYSSNPHSKCVFPEGNIVSVHGHVIDMHGLDNNSRGSFGSVPQLKLIHGISSYFRVHVFANNQKVLIFGSLSKEAYPAEFGPGVSATFHRLLDLGEGSRLMLIPISFIVVESITAKNELHSEQTPSFDRRPMQLHCRVLSVHFLIMENKSNKYDDVRSNSGPYFIDIPLAGVVLDDGSFTWSCWANGERASMLLRLHEELPAAVFESIGLTFKWVEMQNNARRTPLYHLERILKKHKRISVLNHNSLVDTSYHDITVSATSNDGISSSDENLLKHIVLNACFGTSWTVTASMMDLNDVQKVENEHLIEMQILAHSMQNIWASKVSYSNPLSEARDVIHELLNCNTLDFASSHYLDLGSSSCGFPSDQAKACIFSVLDCTYCNISMGQGDLINCLVLDAALS